MDHTLRTSVEAALGARVLRASTVSGGDINHAFCLELGDGRRAFLKTHPAPPARMYTAEAHGLSWLAEARALRIPEVLAVRDEAPAFLALEWIEPGRSHADADEALGRGLAALHRTRAPSFGLDTDNFIALLPQHNSPRTTWPTFYAEARLQPLAARAARAGLLDTRSVAALDQLCARLPALCGPVEPPARLHGDLWAGNRIHDTHGAPVLIDPAVYGGHREIDLAMMRLFGGYTERVFASYAEAYPLAPGHEERIPLYQLYPLLVHVTLFGSSYVNQLRRALARYA